MKYLIPYLLILLGLFVFFFMGMAEPAGLLLLIGIVLTIESIWPEKWDSDAVGK